MRPFFFVTIFLSVFFTAAISQASREINKTFPLKANGHLVIDTYKGTITVTTHDKPQVEVYVKIESDDADSRMLPKMLRTLKLKFTAQIIM